ncbi:recombinase family protein [Patescibacteria group bacterium]
MKKEIEKIKYFVYARKSSESEDRQVASIEAQIDELNKIAEQKNLKIVQVFSESMSAKVIGRPIFNEMVEKIGKGEADGLLCWKLNRLARNASDAGIIIDMLQQGPLKHIQTFGKDFSPEDNVLMMYVEFGVANQFIKDLSADTKRGLMAKARQGWYPGVAKPGYINEKYSDKGVKRVLKDPERFDLIRSAWDLLLTGKYNVPQILNKLNNEWSFKTIKRKKLGGKPMAKSRLYEIFTDTFYYGEYEYPQGSDIWHHGEHKPMITQEEFDKVQVILGRRGRPRPKTHEFAFTGLVRCGECGAMITAEEKWKHQKNGNVHHYTYYHCTKKVNPDCSQKNTRVEDLDKQIDEWLSKIEINERYKDFAIKYLNKTNDKEFKSRESIVKSQQKEYNRCLTELDNLLKLKISPANTDGGLLNDEEYKKQKDGLTKKKARLEELLNDTGDRVEKWMSVAEQIYDFACFARIRFAKGDKKMKKEILSALGQNLSLKDGKLAIQLKEPFKIIATTLSSVPEATRRLEPVKIGVNKGKTPAFADVNPTWLRR